MNKVGKTARGCLIALVIFILADVVFAIAVPVVGIVEVAAIKNLLSPPKPVLFSTIPLQTQMILRQGKLYTVGPNGSTGVYDPVTGKLLTTLPGLVAGGDDQLLYTANGVANIVGNRSTRPPTLGLPLVARNSVGASLWTYSDGSQTISQAQSSGSFVYLLLAHTTSLPTAYTVVAVNQINGVVAWSYSSPDIAKQFVIARNALYLLTGQAVVALDATDGHQLWRQATAANSISSDGERLYLLEYQVLHVLSGQTGMELWGAAYQPATSGASVLVDDDVVYFTDPNRQIAALRAQDGHTLWLSAPSPGKSRSLLAVHGGDLYLYETELTDAAGSKLVAMRGATGQQAWATKMLALAAKDITLIGAGQGIIYFSNAVGRNEFSGLSTQLVAFSESNGIVRWQQVLPEVGGAVLLVGPSLYIAAFLHRSRASGVEFSRRVTDCSDIASLYTLSATSGTIQSQHTQSFACKYDGNY